MPEQSSAQGQFIYPTPAGAYQAVAGKTTDGVRGLLRHLLALDASPLLTPKALAALFQAPESVAIEQFQRLRKLRVLQTLPSLFRAEDQALEVCLPQLLEQLSDNRQSLLADDQGFYLASNAIDPVKAEELAGFAAEFGKLRQRYGDLLAGDQQSAWAFGGARGYNNLGFWELQVGKYTFFLVIGGRPNLNQQAMVELVWRLMHRYGTDQEGGAVGAQESPFSFHQAGNGITKG